MTKQPLPPVMTLELHPEIQAGLLELLASLTPEEWNLPTACEGWSVKDVAQHMLASMLGILSGQRDGQKGAWVDASDWQGLVNFINQQNDTWVRATRRLSPRVICDLLRFGGDGMIAYFQSLDPFAPGLTISWASSERAPIWMEIAREYTEFWTHQQHIRDAVGKMGMKEPRYLTPLLDTFVRGLPRGFEHVPAAENTVVKLAISGEAKREWYLRREGSLWNLYAAVDDPTACTVQLEGDTAWRLFTKGIPAEAARKNALIEGDTALADHVFEVVSIIA